MGKGEVKQTPFRNVLDVYFLGNEVKCCPKFQYAFMVKTTEREFELFSATELEQVLWVTAFRYVIKST